MVASMTLDAALRGRGYRVTATQSVRRKTSCVTFLSYHRSREGTHEDLLMMIVDDEHGQEAVCELYTPLVKVNDLAATIAAIP